MKILKLFIISGFVSFAHSVFADNNISTQKLGEFAEPYNYNSALKMDQQENVAYLATMTQENNGSKRVHLWSMQEGPLTKDTPEHKILISDDLMKPLAPINGSPSKLSLVIHYDGVSSTQYIGWVDSNDHTISILRRTKIGNDWYENPMPTSLQNINPVDTMDMAVQRDGTLLVATVAHNNAHLYKYIINTNDAPEAIEVIDKNSTLNVPTTANYGQFKLVLVGADEVPHVIFPYPSTNSKTPQAGRIAAAYVNNWNQSNVSKTWNESTSYISEEQKEVDPINIEAGSQIDAIASAKDNLIHVALIYDSQRWNAGTVTFDEESTEKWKNFQENRTNNQYINSREAVLANDGQSIYGFYAEDHHAGLAGNTAYTAGEFFNTNTYNEKKTSFNTHEVSRKDYDDTIKYTGLVMYLKDTKGLYYKGFVSTREGDDNHNNLVIKGLTFN